MAVAKSKSKKEKVPDIEETPATEAETVEEEPVAEETPAVPKRSVGPKEQPPFEWKVIGESFGAIVTLFKSIEREDADAQLDRLQRDGYYTNLRIVEAKEVIKQPASAKDAIIPPKSIKAPPPAPPKPKRAARKDAAARPARPIIRAVAGEAKKKAKPVARKPSRKVAPKKPARKTVRKSTPRKKK